jgi:putative phosphoesterase
MAGTAILGLISDTHGLLRPEALKALEECDHILHAGDVGKLEILDKLRQIAPVTAIRGNIDNNSPLPATAIVEAHGACIYMLHDLQELDLDPVAARFDIVVSGHSHKPGQSERSGVLYVNPGSAGPRRFHLPITVARLDLLRLPWQVEFVSLTPAVL